MRNIFFCQKTEHFTFFNKKKIPYSCQINILLYCSEQSKICNVCQQNIILYFLQQNIIIDFGKKKKNIILDFRQHNIIIFTFCQKKKKKKKKKYFTSVIQIFKEI